MVADGLERKLSAILAADLAGYSRLVELDEEGTLRRFEALRREQPCEAHKAYNLII